MISRLGSKDDDKYRNMNRGYDSLDDDDDDDDDKYKNMNRGYYSLDDDDDEYKNMNRDLEKYPAYLKRPSISRSSREKASMLTRLHG